MDQQIWQWTLTKEAITPCFVRDVLAMREHANKDGDFFWLGHTPCRTVLLVGMVVAIQVYEKRTTYTINDGTAVIDCILRHPQPAPPEQRPRSSPRSKGGQDSNSNSKRPSPKKPRLDKTKLEWSEPPPPITEPGYPVCVVGRVVRHYESKQIHADTIDPCPSSLDEIAHLERVIELHKTKYSLAVPFVPPPKSIPHAPVLDMSARDAHVDADASVFSDLSHLRPRTTEYSLALPPISIPLQSRNRRTPLPTHPHAAYHDHTHHPSSPTTSSIASSTPSSPCKPSSPAKAHDATSKPKLRHPSRLHTRDLTGNTFRLYVKYYMDNAPPPFPTSLPSPSRSTCGRLTTPTKYVRDEDVVDDPTPRPHPRPSTRHERDEDEIDDRPTLGFTLSHLRRVPELALLAARVARTEARRREKVNREKERASSKSRLPSTSSASARQNGNNGGNGTSADSQRKKIKRLFSWAVIKLYEEGSIVHWDGDVRPLPVPPPPAFEANASNGKSELWRDTQSRFGDPSASCSRSYAPNDLFLSTISSAPAAVLYSSSASASLYSHYHPPRRSTKHRSGGESGRTGGETEVHDVDADADPGNVSDPGVDEEAYVPLTPRLLATYVREAIVALHRRRGHGGEGVNVDGRETVPAAEAIAKYLQRKDSRWDRVGVWAIEETLAALRAS